MRWRTEHGTAGHDVRRGVLQGREGRRHPPHYERHPLSTGPYRFERHVIGTGLTLVRDPRCKGDRVRTALPDRIEVTERVAAADVDARLLAGTADADPTGASVPATTTIAVRADRPADIAAAGAPRA